MKKKLTYLAICFSVFYTAALRAQSPAVWQSKGALYEDRHIRVEVEYQLGEDPCRPGGAPARFRYHVIRHGRSPSFYIAWRFDYFDCGHTLRSPFNSLHITPQTAEYPAVPNNTFPALQVVNHISYSKAFSRFPQDQEDYHPSSTRSLEPAAVRGPEHIRAGESAVLTLQGGYLVAGAVWKWYEGDCQGAPVGTGAALTVRPAGTTTYFVRAEGRNTTPCVAFRLQVLGGAAVTPGRISGPRETCAGQAVQLRLNGGIPDNGMRWVWYQGEPGGVPIGEGPGVLVSPVVTTVYTVRGEGPEGVTAFQSWTVGVRPPPPPADGIDGPKEAVTGSPLVYAVRGSLRADAGWVWYQLISGQPYRIGSGASVSLKAASSDLSLAVRAESTCGNSGMTELHVRVREPEPVLSAPSYREPLFSGVQPQFFVNGGVASDHPDQLTGLSTYVATLGWGGNLGVYLRGKYSIGGPKSRYETATGLITDYDQPGYYRYTGQHSGRRLAGTGGIFFGTRVLAVYLGGGYGQYEPVYEIGQYGYGGQFSGTAYVRDPLTRLSGAEFEGGLLLRAGFFNLMGGVAVLRGKYTDYHAGIGLNF